MAGPNYIYEKAFRLDPASTGIARFTCVKVTGDELIDQSDGVDQVVFGISQTEITQEEKDLGKLCSVALFGSVRAIAGGAISTGDRLTTNASGRLVSGGLANFIGIALNDAAADGDHFDMIISRDAS